MTESVAHRLLDIVGKGPGAPGILTVAQIPAALTALRKAVAQERAAAASNPEPLEPEDHSETPTHTPVSLAQRVWPLVDLLEAAAQAGEPVTWDH